MGLKVRARARVRVRVRVTDAPGTCSPAAHEVASGPNVKLYEGEASAISCVPVRLMHLLGVRLRVKVRVRVRARASVRVGVRVN